nr:MAG TPA: hypothetical protein [Caudoviricetes sp.]
MRYLKLIVLNTSFFLFTVAYKICIFLNFLKNLPTWSYM